MPNRPKSKALPLREPKGPKPVPLAAQFRIIYGHRFVRTPHGWLCDRCSTRPSYVLFTCEGHSN